MRNPELTAARWIESRLFDADGLDGLGVWQHPAPEDVDGPVITYSFEPTGLTVTDVSQLPLHHFVRVRVRVTGLTESFTTLEPLAERVDELLAPINNSAVPGTDAFVYTARYVRPHTIIEPDGYRSLGAVYELIVSA